MLSCFSHVRLFATPGTVVRQVPLSMDFPGKNTGEGCHFLLQGIFATQGSITCLGNCTWILYRRVTGEALIPISTILTNSGDKGTILINLC